MKQYEGVESERLGRKGKKFLEQNVLDQNYIRTQFLTSTDMSLSVGSAEVSVVDC